MITTWQKILAVSIGLIFGAIVGYICIKPHLEDNSIPTTQNVNTNDVFEQYLNNDSNNDSNDNNEIKQNTNVEE